MPQLKPSPELAKACGGLHQDVFLEATGPDGLAQVAMKMLSQEEARLLARQLDSLLANHTASELKGLLNRACAATAAAIRIDNAKAAMRLIEALRAAAAAR